MLWHASCTICCQYMMSLKIEGHILSTRRNVDNNNKLQRPRNLFQSKCVSCDRNLYMDYLKVVRNKKSNFFFSWLFDRVLRDKSNEPCPAFVRYRYPIEMTPQIFHFSYFSRETAVQESLIAPFFWPKMPKPRCV